MKPFSPFKFFIENKKKALVSFIVLIFTVCAVSLITGLVNSIPDTVTDINLKPLEYYSGIYADNGQNTIKESIVTHLKQDKNIERLVDADYANTSVTLAIGGNTGVPVPFMKRTDLIYFLKKTGDSIKDGRLPKADEDGIIVHWRIMKNKGWHLGDFVGKDVDKQEWIRGKHKIVGIVEGPVVLAGGIKLPVKAQTGEAITEANPSLYLLFFKSGKRKEVNDYLGTIQGAEAGTFYYEETKQSIDSSLNGLSSTLLIIIIVVVLILSISVSALMYIIYLQRSDEFGIMYAMGYNNSFIRNMIIKEIMSLNFLGWAFGLLFSLFVVYILNQLIYYPKGNLITILSLKVLIYTAIIPLMVAACSILPITRKLKKWDPVAIIERRD